MSESNGELFHSHGFVIIWRLVKLIACLTNSLITDQHFYPPSSNVMRVVRVHTHTVLSIIRTRVK